VTEASSEFSSLNFDLILNGSIRISTIIMLDNSMVSLARNKLDRLGHTAGKQFLLPKQRKGMCSASPQFWKKNAEKIQRILRMWQ